MAALKNMVRPVVRFFSWLSRNHTKQPLIDHNISKVTRKDLERWQNGLYFAEAVDEYRFLKTRIFDETYTFVKSYIFDEEDFLESFIDLMDGKESGNPDSIHDYLTRKYFEALARSKEYTTALESVKKDKLHPYNKGQKPHFNSIIEDMIYNRFLNE